MNENNQELSLVDIWKRIWGHRFLVIIITAIVVILGTALLFVYSRSNTTVSNQYNYKFLNIGSNRYPDGSPFDFRLVKTEDFLEEIKSKNIDFSTLDVTKLLDDSSFEVSFTQQRLTNSETVIDSYYTITIPTSYFGYNRKITEKFISTIHTEIINIAKEKNKALSIYDYFNTNLDLSRQDFNSLPYFEIIDLIRRQYSLVNTSYTSFIEKNGDVELSGLKFSDIQRDLNLWYTNILMIDNLEAEMNENNYVQNDAQSKKVAEVELIRLKKALVLNQNIIDQLVIEYGRLNAPQTTDGGAILDEITRRVVSNELYKESITLYEKIINEPANDDPEFHESLENATQILSSKVAEYNTLSQAYYDENTRYIPHGTNEYTLNQPMGLVLSILVTGMFGGIFGVIAALVKAAIIENNQKLKLKQEEV